MSYEVRAGRGVTPENKSVPFLLGGNINGAIAGAAAPYVAQTIKQVAGDNDTARVMAHAVLGAVVAQAQGNSAGAGAAGAVTGELIAGVIIKQLYGGVDPQDLTEEQKQKVSALSTLASGLAGAVVGGDAANAVAGAQGGRNAVENNLLSNKYGVEKLDEKGRALYERLVAAGIGSIDDLQEQFVACGGEGGCERDIRNKYQDQEREAGEKLLSLYRSGELSADEFGLLVTRYAKAMFDGIVEAQRNSDGGGFLGDIYRQSGGDWSPAGVIANPFLSAIRASELIAEWKSQGLSDDKINELALKDAVLGSVLSPGDINGVTKLLDNGASGDDVLRYTVMAVLGAVLGGKSGTKATGPVPNLTERGTLVNLRPNDVAIAQRPVRTLVQDESGRYWLQTSTGKRITPSGSYDFVTMPDGSVRVARPNVNQDFSTHLGLSGGGEVRYAGSIRFGNNDGPSRGTITQWTNNSGHYQPPATLSGNAGLPQGLFNPR